VPPVPESCSSTARASLLLACRLRRLLLLLLLLQAGVANVRRFSPLYIPSNKLIRQFVPNLSSRLEVRARKWATKPCVARFT
jgi:hypothetical protein